jgi:hypothetical protein
MKEPHSVYRFVGSKSQLEKDCHVLTELRLNKISGKTYDAYFPSNVSVYSVHRKGNLQYSTLLHETFNQTKEYMFVYIYFHITYSNIFKLFHHS